MWKKYTQIHAQLFLTALSLVEDEKSKCLSTEDNYTKRFYALTERNEDSFYNEME